jgi:Na+/phosphate symporter
MVAMGSSLADRAWGRDSAVYRISGVITVIGGWFFTAFSAFTAAFVMAYLIHLGGIVTIIALIVLIVILLFKSSAIHKKRESEKVLTEDKTLLGVTVNGESVLRSCRENVVSTIFTLSQLYSKSISGLLNFKRKPLFNALNEVGELEKDIRFLKNSLPKIIARLHEEEIESGHYYVQVIDYLKETVNSITYIVKPIFNYIDNNHKPLLADQKSELSELKNSIDNFHKAAIKILEEDGFENLESILKDRHKLIDNVTRINKRQLKRIKNKEVGTKNSTLYLNILSETKNLLLFTINLIEAQRDFLVHNNGAANPVEEIE